MARRAKHGVAVRAKRGPSRVGALFSGRAKALRVRPLGAPALLLIEGDLTSAQPIGGTVPSLSVQAPQAGLFRQLRNHSAPPAPHSTPPPTPAAPHTTQHTTQHATQYMTQRMNRGVTRAQMSSLVDRLTRACRRTRVGHHPTSNHRPPSLTTNPMHLPLRRLE